MYQAAINNNDLGWWTMVKGEETPGYESFKLFAYDKTAIGFTYDNYPTASTIASGSPADGAGGAGDGDDGDLLVADGLGSR